MPLHCRPILIKFEKKKNPSQKAAARALTRVVGARVAHVVPLEHGALRNVHLAEFVQHLLTFPDVFERLLDAGGLHGSPLPDLLVLEHLVADLLQGLGEKERGGERLGVT